MLCCSWRQRVGQSYRGRGCHFSAECIAATNQALLLPTSQPPPSHPLRIPPHTRSTLKYPVNGGPFFQQPLDLACRKSSPLTSASLIFPFTAPPIKRDSRP